MIPNIIHAKNAHWLSVKKIAMQTQKAAAIPQYKA